MSIHLHRARQWTGWTLGFVALSPFALCIDPPIPKVQTAPVTGRVTYSGRPLNDMTLCIDEGGLHSAYALLQTDGSFRLINQNLIAEGAMPGRYRAHLYTHDHGPKLPPRYGDPETSGIELEVVSGWNDFHIDLR